MDEESSRATGDPWPVALHFMYYNFAHLHKTLRVTPAMVAGVTDKLWEIGDMVALVEAKEAALPLVRGLYKKRQVVA